VVDTKSEKNVLTELCVGVLALDSLAVVLDEEHVGREGTTGLVGVLCGLGLGRTGRLLSLLCGLAL